MKHHHHAHGEPCTADCQPFTEAESHEWIAVAAYFIWQADGEQDGTADQDWENAEREIAEIV